jgi:hypothetical protein
MAGHQTPMLTRTPLRRRLARAAVFVGLVLTLLGLVSQPALAHGPMNPDAPLYRTTLTSVSPPVTGLEVIAAPNGDWIQVTNDTGHTLMVLGYTGEPYLRFDQDGVAENVASLSSYLNSSYVISQIPTTADSPQQQPPRWVHRTDGHTFRWHDHRVHWMAATRPPVVAADPEHPHRITSWTVRMDLERQQVTVRGTLDWIGEDDMSWPMLALLGVVLLAVLLAILRLPDLLHHPDKGATTPDPAITSVLDLPPELTGEQTPENHWERHRT